MQQSARTVAFAFLMAFTFAACGSGGQPEGGSTTATEASQPASQQPEVYLYGTFYDAVLLRETPDLKGKVVTRLPMGSFLEGSGERSKEKTEATLGGITWLEPFLKATYLTPDQQTGWIHGATVETVYVGPRADSPNLGDLTKFGSHLAQLDVKLMGSGEKAWAYVRQHHATAKGPLADAIYMMLERYLSRIEGEANLYTLTESMEWSDQDYEKVYKNNYDMTQSAPLKAIDAAGFRLATAEGMIFPVTDRKKLLDFFGKNVTPGMKQYLEQSWLELAQPSMSDAHIAIELEELADRGIFWENFNAAYPYFARRDETIEHESWVRLVMINGLVFDEETKAPYAEYSKAWAYIMRKYPDTKLGKAVAEFTQLLVAEGNKRTPKVEAYQTEYAKNYDRDTQ